MDAFLEDNYLHTRTALNLRDTTRYDFAVNTDAGSAAPDRFRIVLGAAGGALPVTFTNVKAYLKNENIPVEWSVDNETGIKYYEVLKSVDGVGFTSAAEIIANNTPVTSNYSWLDELPVAGSNYYRIKCVGVNGEINYSKIVQVFAGNRKTRNFRIPESFPQWHHPSSIQ